VALWIASSLTLLAMTDNKNAGTRKKTIRERQ
jgi:hypothetical protein